MTHFKELLGRHFNTIIAIHSMLRVFGLQRSHTQPQFALDEVFSKRNEIRNQQHETQFNETQKANV